MKSLCLVTFLIMAGACTEHGKGGQVPGTDGGGQVCGGFAGAVCGANEFCDFPRNSCGASDESGVCRTKPSGCPDVFDPVCGCDGLVHSSPCDANAVGADLSAGGGCTLPVGSFTCGFKQCVIDSEVCQRQSSDVGNEPDSFTCTPMPVGCSPNPSCACLVGEPCGSICSGNATTGLELDCPGG